VKTVVRYGRSAAVLAEVDDAVRLLTETERARADAFRMAGDREAYVAAHVLVRLCAAEALGATAGELTIVQRCDSCGGPHGRPSVVEAPDLSVSWSHTAGGVAAVAGAGPVGVDIEGLHGRDFELLRRKTLTAGELRWAEAQRDPDAAFLRLWTRKEALIKVGKLSLGSMAEADLVGDDGGPGGPVACWEGFRFEDWGFDEFVGSCALPVDPAETRGVDPGLEAAGRLEFVAEL
jgi:4'-phosphopantetheinyl transferase